MIPNDPQDLWEKIFGLLTRQKRTSLEGLISISSGIKLAFLKKKLIWRVKRGGGIVMGCGCFAASGLGRLALIDRTMNSALLQKIHEENVQQSGSAMKRSRALGLCSWTMIWNIKNNKIRFLEWPSESSRLNLIEICMSLKKVAHAWKMPNELKQS